MSQDPFKALVLHQMERKTTASIESVSEEDLPEGDVLVAVEYSSLNYKDGLAVTGKGKVVLVFPIVPGVDLAGTVLTSESPAFKPGDRIVVTGWGLGERQWGGYARKARVRSEWILPMPAGLDARRAMAIGTAGFTAMLCVMALEEAGVAPDSGPVLVTGAGGGVGSIAVAILANLGYQVTALTGRPEIHDSLRELGASEIVERSSMEEPPRPLESQRWAGAVDTVGSKILARVLAETYYRGAVAACGLAAGFDLPATVMPFILRGVRLSGVESVLCPMPQRKIAWARLVQDLPMAMLDRLTRVISLEQVPAAAADILAGKVHGRVVIDLNA
jgi:acrylyl-CoA reductase (NADPH)